jgi:hypothetical protein
VANTSTPTYFYKDSLFKFKNGVFVCEKQCFGSALVSTRIPIPIQFFISMQIQIWIQGAKPMRIYADPDPGQTLPKQRVGFRQQKIYFL